MLKRICLVSELFPGEPGEGYQRYIVSFAHAIKNQSKVKFTVITNDKTSATEEFICRINFNKLFINTGLISLLKKIKPDILIYIPSASNTFMSYIRCRMLKQFANCETVMIGLQPRKLYFFQQKVVKKIQPDVVLVQSAQRKAELQLLGLNSVKLIDSGVDLKIFKKVFPKSKADLRLKYGLGINKYTIVHVGHLIEGRNVKCLSEIAKIKSNQVLMVCSPFTTPDSSLRKELEKNGVIIIDKYLPKIEEIYQLSDLYYFPVVSEKNSIEMPLSVLEALACGIPVLTTPFGGLNRLSGLEGVNFIDNERDILSQVNQIKQKGEPNTSWISQYNWHQVVERFLRSIGVEG